MTPFPYKKFRITSTLSLDEVASRFRDHIETDKIRKLMVAIPTRNFEGKLTYDNINNQYKFELYRLGRWKHLPFRVYGTVGEAENKTLIEMQIEPHFLYILYSMILLGFTVIAIIGQMLSGDFSWFPAFIFFPGAIYIVYRYLSEARKNIELIISITQGKVFRDKLIQN